MGPMMGGWSGGGGGFGPALVVVLVLALGLIALAVWRGGGTPAAPRRPRSPEEVLRDRYAKGEISRGQYLEALTDILKDRYVRGEIELEDFEARLDRLLGVRQASIGGQRESGPPNSNARENLPVDAGTTWQRHYQARR